MILNTSSTQFLVPDAADSWEHSASDLIRLFDTAVGQRYRTRLHGGSEEPVYLPAERPGDFHGIHFTHDYFASALHEVAHWCVAGEQRRQLTDYGYWYAPDGRDERQQALFEQVEIKPQALEWIFATACGFPFKVSVDNLTGNASASDSFRFSICQQTHRYCEEGLPYRAGLFTEQLKKFYGVDNPLSQACYSAAFL